MIDNGNKVAFLKPGDLVYIYIYISQEYEKSCYKDLQKGTPDLGEALAIRNLLAWRP